MGARGEHVQEIRRKDLIMKKLVCAIYERRPRTKRSIRDNRAAKFIDKVEFNVQGDTWRKYEITEILKTEIESRGHTIAGVPYPTKHTEFDWVAYVEPEGNVVPFTRREKKKPVSVGAGSVKRRIPLPTRGQRAQKLAVPRTSSVLTKRPTRTQKKDQTIPPRRRPSHMKRRANVQQTDE